MTAAEKAQWKRAALLLVKAAGVCGVLLAVAAGMSGASFFEMLATAVSGAICSIIVKAITNTKGYKGQHRDRG